MLNAERKVELAEAAIEGNKIARNQEEKEFVEAFLSNSKADQYDILDTLQYDLTVESVEILYPEGFADELIKSLNK